jgi:hypothetical protein
MGDLAIELGKDLRPRIDIKAASSLAEGFDGSTDSEFIPHGVNDMVLDNWGVVDRWIAEEKITSHGASRIGFGCDADLVRRAWGDRHRYKQHLSPNGGR